MRSQVKIERARKPGTLSLLRFKGEMSGVLWVHPLLEKVKLKSKSQIKVREGENGVTQSNQLIIQGFLK